MSPTHFHAKTENGLCPPPLKLHKDSCLIKKPSPASSSSTSSLVSVIKPQQQERHGPVIIYTHSPKIIHTHPKDFRSLVQKLTGLSRSEEEDDVVCNHRQKSSETTMTEDDDDNKTARILLGNDDTESSSVITDENCSSVGDVNVGQVNSCFMPPIFEPPTNPYMADIPVFTPNSAEFLRSNQPFYGCTDSLFFTPNIMTRGMNDFRDY